MKCLLYLEMTLSERTQMLVPPAGVSSLWNHLQLNLVHGSRGASSSAIWEMDVWRESGETNAKLSYPGTIGT